MRSLRSHTHKPSSLRAKLADRSGESLVETLVATLIMGLVMLMLCTAIVAAAKINATARANDPSFDQTAASVQKLNDMSVLISPDTAGVTGGTLGSGEGGPINAYKTENGYYFYEPAKRAA